MSKAATLAFVVLGLGIAGSVVGLSISMANNFNKLESNIIDGATSQSTSSTSSVSSTSTGQASSSSSSSSVVPSVPGVQVGPFTNVDGRPGALDLSTYPASDGITYTYNDSDHTAVAGRGNFAGDVLVIPATVDKDGTTYNVTRVSSFIRMPQLKYVFIPKYVTRFGWSGDSYNHDTGAFFADTGLIEIQFASDSVLTGMSYEYGGLFGDSEHEFRYDQFTYINIPDAVTYFDPESFRDVSGLTNFTFPSAINTIKANCFKYCTGLKSIVIPDSVTSMEDKLFEYCYSLQSIKIGTGVTSVGKYFFSHCWALKTVTLPDTITELWDSCFNDCQGLEEITLPASLTCIRPAIFSGCVSLTHLYSPANAGQVYELAFNNCISLKWVAFTKALSSVGSSAFKYVPSTCNIYVTDGDTGDFNTDNNPNGCPIHTVGTWMMVDGVPVTQTTGA